MVRFSILQSFECNAALMYFREWFDLASLSHSVRRKMVVY